MYVSDLVLQDFRSYTELTLHLESGITTFIGQNGQGKTNIAESLIYLSTLKSHRTSQEASLVKAGQKKAVIRAKVWEGKRQLILEAEVRMRQANRLLLNGVAISARDFLGNLTCVVFSPEDLALISGGPAQRRNYLDSVLVQLRPRLSQVFNDYEQAAKQRAAALKAAGKAQFNHESYDEALLDVWDSTLARLSSHISAARASLIQQLRPLAATYYAQLAPHSRPISLAYAADALRGYEKDRWVSQEEETIYHALTHPSTLTYAHMSQENMRVLEKSENMLMEREKIYQHVRERMRSHRQVEMMRGINLVGAHRDDVLLYLGYMPAKGFASHGETWSYALALKLAAWKLLTEDTSGQWAQEREPLLILDDVFAELDAQRRETLADIISHAQQVIITAAVENDIPEQLRSQPIYIHDSTVSN